MPQENFGKTQIRHVRNALKREFGGLIDLDDLTHTSDTVREQAFLSRALAALVVRHLTGFDNPTAAATVIDGRDDIGIDAVATDESASHLWLIQSKWSDTGRATFGVSEALKFLEGLRHIDSRRFSRFNAKFQHLKDRVSEVLENPGSRITLVPALMRTDPLTEDVEQRLKDEENEFNQFGTMLDYRIFLLRDIWEIVRNDVADPPISLTAKMHDWIKIAQPYEAFQGTVNVVDIAQWYEANGDRLFNRNIRKPLGLTRVNQRLVETLTSEAHNFWYFNNGITILCNGLECVPFSRSSRSPVTLYLKDASVVNGAQTVHAIYEAYRKDSEAISDGYVTVRVISLTNCPSDFAEEVTVATNTQNSVERRDFVALDRVQAAIKEDFALSLQKTYVVKRGEPEPSPEAGCSVVTAATALACAHRNPELAIRAKRNVDLLWEEGPQGAYHLLFNPEDPPTAYQVWRTVLILRKVEETLHQTAKERQARAEAIAERGNRLIAHIAFQYLDLDDIDDPAADWDAILAQVPNVVKRATALLIHHLDARFGSNSIVASTLANVERCRTLAALVLADLRGNVAVPELPADYRPSRRTSRRRPNAVHTLIDAGRLAEGTALTYRAGTQPEREALAAWLAEDPKRETATWINERVRPLLWAADGKRYSPSGLVKHMWRCAGWNEAPVAVQGPKRWYLADGTSLWNLALETLASLAEDAEEVEGAEDEIE